MASREQVLMLYRHILHAAKKFPSIKKDAIIQDIKLEFREHKDLTDVEVVRKHVETGIRSLEQLQSFAGMDNTSKDFQVFLKGSACG